MKEVYYKGYTLYKEPAGWRVSITSCSPNFKNLNHLKAYITKYHEGQRIPKKTKNVYKVAKSGGDNLGGPALKWFIVLGPGVYLTHYPKRWEAKHVAVMMNLAWAEAQKRI